MIRAVAGSSVFSAIRTTVAAAAFALGCGGGHSSPDAPAGFQPAAHTQLPLLDMHTGAILKNVQLVTLTYSDYPDTANVEAFGDYVVTSPWFTQVTSEYGVGAGTHAAKFHMGPTPTTMLAIADVETQIKTLIMNSSVPQPPATGNEYLYMIYIPHAATKGPDLTGFFGYHSMITVNGINVPYAVILDDGSGTDTTTSTAAHELVEAATDTLFTTNQNGDGWWADKALPDPWFLVETEAADLCDGEALIRSGTFEVQRIWSNNAIMAGKSPCVPYDPDDVWFDVSADPPAMPHVPAGGNAVFTLTGWSTVEVPDWKLATYVADFSDVSSTDLNATLSAPTINNGKTVMLTLHVPTTAQSGQNGGVYVLSGDQQRPWVVGYIVQ